MCARPASLTIGGRTAGPITAAPGADNFVCDRGASVGGSKRRRNGSYWREASHPIVSMSASCGAQKKRQSRRARPSRSADVDGVADHVGWAFLALGSLGHGVSLTWGPKRREMEGDLETAERYRRRQRKSARSPRR